MLAFICLVGGASFIWSSAPDSRISWMNMCSPSLCVLTELIHYKISFRISDSIMVHSAFHKQSDQPSCSLPCQHWPLLCNSGVGNYMVDVGQDHPSITPSSAMLYWKYGWTFLSLAIIGIQVCTSLWKVLVLVAQWYKKVEGEK